MDEICWGEGDGDGEGLDLPGFRFDWGLYEVGAGVWAEFWGTRWGWG